MFGEPAARIFLPLKRRRNWVSAAAWCFRLADRNSGATSVADRGEDWGRRFDAILQQLPGEHIVELDLQQSSDQAYATANSKILDQAEGLASVAGRRALAMVVWNGLSRGPTDWTDQFRKLAVDRKLEVIPVFTL